ncbi:helix-turn-helix domain-containing protein [Streptomyces sp. NPDC086081]|uniref:helix-turn-helix domain-containing protein n=1 Tax=Streptomyces sp. NPDC086081 TaxID=3365749 RepID=UPI0038028DB3
MTPPEKPVPAGSKAPSLNRLRRTWPRGSRHASRTRRSTRTRARTSKATSGSHRRTRTPCTAGRDRRGTQSDRPRRRRANRSHTDRPLPLPASGSRIADISVRHVTRLFTDHLGQTPARFVRQSRLTAAAHLLTTTTLSLPDIAARCGFRSAEALRLAFHRRFGLLPRATEPPTAPPHPPDRRPDPANSRNPRRAPCCSRPASRSHRTGANTPPAPEPHLAQHAALPRYRNRSHRCSNRSKAPPASRLLWAGGPQAGCPGLLGGVLGVSPWLGDGGVGPGGCFVNMPLLPRPAVYPVG